MPSRTIWRWGAFLLLCAAIAAFLAFDLGTYLSLEFLKASQHQLATFYAAAPFQTLASYFLLYVLTTALSLPGAAVLTLAGGALFGVGTGLLVVSFASSLGATLAMLIARFLLKDWVQQKFGQRLEPLHSGV
ncbi:MAG: pyridine nucleotide-disulfide oxidoreductase, partial [Burkholderiaceae bacterium]